MSPCVLWTKGKTGPGYGALYVNGKQVLAHRHFFAQRFGPIPKGKFVLHRCDQRACYNTDHLYLGTAKDNTADAWRKGRLPHPPHYQGEKHPSAKLSAKQVRQIRKAVLDRDELSFRFKVSKTHISRIRNHHSWKSL